VLKGAVLLVRFLSELALLAGVGWLGWHEASGGWLSVLSAIVEIVVIALVWGLLIAPRAKRRLADPARLGLEILLFGGTAAALFVQGHPVIAVVGGVIALAAAFGARPLKA
jgi:hypothetical protein